MTGSQLHFKTCQTKKEIIIKGEKHALMALQNDTNITILLADKENATVLMLDQDYHNKMRSVLNDLV